MAQGQHVLALDLNTPSGATEFQAKPSYPCSFIKCKTAALLVMAHRAQSKVAMHAITEVYLDWFETLPTGGNRAKHHFPRARDLLLHHTKLQGPTTPSDALPL
jgi:hypothetical protein